MKPSASAPASTAADASSKFVTPQILTLTLIIFPTTLSLSPEYFRAALAIRPRESLAHHSGPTAPRRRAHESRSRPPKSFQTGLPGRLRLTSAPAARSLPD